MHVSTRSLALALALALTASCNAPSHLRAIKTADRLEEFRLSIEDLRAQAAATSTALSALVASKDQDPSLAYQQLESAVHALESSQHHAHGRLRGIHEEADAYFEAWKEQAATIGDEDLKERSEDRRAELAEAVERVEKSAQPAHEALDAYLESLHDTLKYLSIDLSPSAIASIEGRSKSASKSVKAIHGKLEDVLECVKEVAPLFATARASTPRHVEMDQPSTN
jgi:chromosome segregation ATPase